MENFPQRIWLVGGSVRSAAGSALRAGWQTICTDFFADADLRRLAQVEPVEHYPAGLVKLADMLPPGPWMYTGGLENHPEIVAAISRRHSLWGNNADSLHRARDPFLLADVLNRAGLPTLAVRQAAPEDNQRWLRKPVLGSGGCGITEWHAKSNSQRPRPSLPYESPEIKSGSYYQKHVTGESISALFLSWPGETRLLEVTAQLTGVPEVHAPQFRWCGNIATLPISDECHKVITRIGETVAEACFLRGLFGCDFILSDDGTPWLTEVNPRYTGSVELVEFLRKTPLLDWHRRACALAEQGGGTCRPSVELASEISGRWNEDASGFAGKLILYNADSGTAA
ncbi:MAG: ATP-grasp domain-containing protein, partial [Planctomycetales bacterium]|nr:ATP-grasp domain-containing protein [Planctomycetales bacterium]